MSGGTPEWVLRRVGVTEPEFTLQNHLEELTVGRSEENNKQCLSVFISRRHAKLKKIYGADGCSYWTLEHLSKTSHTFVNGIRLRVETVIRLNNNDLISFGENNTPESGLGSSKKFLYRLLAPSFWTLKDEGDPSAQTQPVILDCVTPPRELSPPISPESTLKTHPSINEKQENTSNRPINETLSKGFKGETSGWSSATLSRVSLSGHKGKSVKKEILQKEEMAFSQVEEIICLDEGQEKKCLASTFSNDFPNKTFEIKSEADSDDEIQIIDPPQREEDDDEIELINIDDDELQLADSQKDLFIRIAHKIKTEEMALPSLESTNVVSDDIENHDVIFLDEDENPFENMLTKENDVIEKETRLISAAISEKPFPTGNKVKQSSMKTLLIDPLPHKPRRSNRRNFKESDSGANKTSGSLTTSKVSTSEKVKANRTEKLKEIAAEQGRKKVDLKEKPRLKSAVKVSSTKPKIEKKGLGDPTSLIQPFKANLKRTSNVTSSAPSKKSRVGDKTMTEKCDGIKFKKPLSISVNKVRVLAEKYVEEQGCRRIAKLKFDNAITNVFSQDLTNTPFNTIKTLSYSGLEKKLKKKVSWKNPLTEVKEIALSGKARKVHDYRDCPNSFKIFAPAGKRNSENLLSIGFTYDDAISHILLWNTMWLEEQSRVKFSPKVELNRFKLSHVPSVFDNFKDYENVFFPLMFYEVWGTVYKDYLNRKVKPVRQAAEILGTNLQPNSVVRLRLRSLLTSEDKQSRHFIFGGSLVKINFISKSGNKSLIKPYFGYVTANKIFPRDESSGLSRLLKDYPEDKADKLLFVNEYCMMVHYKEKPTTEYKNLPIVELISYIRPSLRIFKAVIESRKSNLFPLLLKPQDTPSDNLIVGPLSANLPIIKKLNPSQRKIVVDVAETCIFLPKQTPYVSLIQGPPGTGKSTVITGLILQCIHRAKSTPGQAMPKILVVAPSNTAVDELIIKIKKECDSHVSLVRVGQVSSIDSQVYDVEIGHIVEHQLKELEAHVGSHKSIKLEILQRQEEIATIERNIQKEHSQSKLNLLLRRLKKEQNKLKRAKNSIQDTLSGTIRDCKRQEIMKKVFEEANVIATTLSSSLNGLMAAMFQNVKSSFSKPSSFFICIIDEASQCVEPEGLIPLSLGFSKLVMVGDPEQLSATVSSVEAKNLSYGQSLFNRLFKQKINDSANSSGLHRLNVQYRMHGEISRWPNYYFYGGDLTNGVSSTARNSVLFPLRLFDLSWTLTNDYSDGSSFFNKKEAIFVARLVAEIQKKRSNLPGNKTIGVITFYSHQRKHLSIELLNHGIRTTDERNPSPDTVVVRTVDGFQGSECDIIVISCVRSFKNGDKYNTTQSIGFISESERLNVALTRAKYALYVVGNFTTLSKNKMWCDFIKDARKRKCFVTVGEKYSSDLLQSYIFK